MSRNLRVLLVLAVACLLAVGLVTGSGASLSTFEEPTVQARISISPDGVKPVGGEHELTAKVEVKIGNGPWGPAPSDGTTMVRFNLSGAGAPVSGQVNPVATDASGEAKYTITSAAAGVSTVSASATVRYNNEDISVSTDGQGENSGPATATWWDARINIGPDGTSLVGENYESTAKVEVKIGSDSWGPAPGVDVFFALVGVGAPIANQLNPVPTDANGEANYAMSSDVAGVSTVSASADVEYEGQSICVETNIEGHNSGPAVKAWEWPKGEDAWAANGTVPGELRYNQGRGGNWATYVAYPGAEKSVSIFASQTQYVGTATLSDPVDGFVTISIDFEEGEWAFHPDGSTNVYVQDYSSAPRGNPAPGRFKWKQTASGTTTDIVVAENEFYGIHLNVYRLLS